MCQKLLKISGDCIWDNFSHAIHVFPGTRLHQTASILTRLFSNIAGTENEMLTVSVYKRHESSAHCRKHGLRGFIKFSPVAGTLSPGFFS
jgi:hypothetical protein